jgi:hypothetical protein
MRKSLILLAIIPGTLAAQNPPPVKLINLPDATTKPKFGVISGVRHLPGGQLIVNDMLRRQLTLLDPALGTSTIIADSTSGSANSYGTRPGGLIAYLGDSTLFIDPAGLSMFVIDPKGAIARVASVPRSQDANSFIQGASVDAKGRIVYRSQGGRGGINITRSANNNGAANQGPMFSMPDPPDTAAIVRIDPSSRKLDTAGFYKIPKMKMNMTQTDGRMSVTVEQNPLPIVDDWAVLSDGSVALIRGRDYHIDFINADGSVTATSKLPFDWQKLSDEDKIAVVDSAKAAAEKARQNMATMSPERAMAEAMAGGGGRAGGAAPVMVFSMGGDGGGGARSNTTVGGPGGPGGPSPLQFVPPSELPDYRPPFMMGAARGDLDGNLWVRTTAVRSGAVNAGPIYDVINRKGEVVERIQVPAGRSIIGFGPGGIVYMQARDERGAWIERTKK